jgi:phosphoglucosamine mutase
MLFGTSGIRGLYGTEITEKLALDLGKVFASTDVCIGRDTRQTGLSLYASSTKGVLSRGKNVFNLNIVPTPTVALATLKHSAKGLMITASHNPPEYNGFKLIEDGHEISKKREKEIEGIFDRGVKESNSEEQGSVFSDDFIIDDHKNQIISLVDAPLIQKKKPKIVLDCNGAASVITPFLLRQLGCKVISLNSELSSFNRPSEPNSENLHSLRKLVPKIGADLGIAHDGDGDRTIAVDESGNILPLDIQLAIMVDHELENNKNKKIISTMESSLALKDTIENAGGKMTLTPVGSTYVAESLELENALFGGEPCGEYIYSKGVHVPDGPLAAAKLIEILINKGPFGKLVKNYKINPIAREKFKTENKYIVIEAVKKDLTIDGELSEDDGVRIDEEDGWFMIRASGTEPIVRLTMEYVDKKKLDNRKEDLSKLIKDKIKETT